MARHQQFNLAKSDKVDHSLLVEEIASGKRRLKARSYVPHCETRAQRDPKMSNKRTFAGCFHCARRKLTGGEWAYRVLVEAMAPARPGADSWRNASPAN
jgi:hypothetical protein